MRDEKSGKFVSGASANPGKLFEKGWRGVKACHDAEWLRWRHHQMGESLKEMAGDAKCQCSVANIRHWMKKLGVEVRG